MAHAPTNESDATVKSKSLYFCVSNIQAPLQGLETVPHATDILV